MKLVQGRCSFRWRCIWSTESEIRDPAAGREAQPSNILLFGGINIDIVTRHFCRRPEPSIKPSALNGIKSHFVGFPEAPRPSLPKSV